MKKQEQKEKVYNLIIDDKGIHEKMENMELTTVIGTFKVLEAKYTQFMLMQGMQKNEKTKKGVTLY